MWILKYSQRVREGREEELKSKLLLLVLVFSTLIFFGSQALSPIDAFTLEATVEIRPNTINLNRQGRWITVFITLPQGYNVSDIDRSTIRLEGQFSPDWSNLEGDKLMVKFDAALITQYLWMQLFHMGDTRRSIQLKVTGQLENGAEFIGSDTVTVMNQQG